MNHKLSRAIALGLLLCGAGSIQTQAAAPAAPQGVITEEVFKDIGGGTTVADLTGNAKFQAGTPDAVNYRPYFEYQASGDITIGAQSDVFNNAGARMAGYFYPPSTGDYIFFICSDDGGQLFLSTDDNPANKKLIAEETGWSGNRNYTGIGGGSTVEAKNSSTYTSTQWPTKDTGTGGAKITLTKGKVYYIEALEKEGGGGDDLSVAVQDPVGAIDSTMPIPGEYLASYDKQSGPLTIDEQPKSLTVNALDAAVFKIVLNGTPPYTYQWQQNGSDIADATNAVYSIARTTGADNNTKFKVKVTGANGSLTSSEVLLTVNTDNTPPALAKVSGSATFTGITVKFSEPVDPTTAGTAANYTLTGGITISAATQSAAPNDDTVVLTTSKQSEGATLSLTVSNVKDLAGNVMVTATKDFVTDKFATGLATYSRWNYAADPRAITVLVDGLTAGTMPSPTVETAVSQFGGPWGVGDNYFARVFGFFIAPFSGNYVFFVAADDQVNLYLSTDADPANKKLIAQEGGWSNQYQWITPGSGDPSTKRSDQFTGTEWPDGITITLKAGSKYYIEMLHKEGGGGDGSDATFIKEGDPDPAQSAAGMFLLGSAIATYADPNGASVTFTQQPQSVTIAQNNTTVLTSAATGTSAYGTNVSFQWQMAAKGGTAFADIAGALSSSYTTPLLALADDGNQYRVIASVPTLSVTSSVAVVSINQDVTAPTVTSAGALKGDSVVGVAFSELMDPSSATNTANYTVTGATVNSAALHFGKYVELGLAANLAAAPSVTVKNAKDLAGNMIVTATVTADLVDMISADIGDPGVNPLQSGNAFAAGNGTFVVAGGGADIWDVADGFHYLYQEFTGPFDMRTRVEAMNPTGLSTWAKAELMVRETTAAGSRHSSVCVTRSKPGGEDALEGQYRDTTDGASTNVRYVTPVPYPNAWLRLVREDAAKNDIKLYTSTDGVAWTLQGTHTTPGDILPAKVLVGMAVTSHDNSGNDVLAEGLYQSFSIKPYQATVDPQLKIGFDASKKVSITWAAGTLVSSPTVDGAYTPVAGATSPHVVTPTVTTFYRIQQ